MTPRPGEIEYLDLRDLLDLATSLLGDPPPVRDLGLLEAAVARPRASVFGEDAYPDVLHKAAALFQSLVKDHALVDGNKRLSWLATATFLELNGYATTEASNNDVYNFVLDAAAHHREIDAIAQSLRKLSTRKQTRI